MVVATEENCFILILYTMNQIVKNAWQQAMDYASYRQMVGKLVAEGRTTGPNQSEDLAHYTKLNESRMKRLDRTTQLDAELNEAVSRITSPQQWLLITEAWCGDAAQSVPIIAALAAQNPQIQLRLLLRDEYPEVMDLYLTNRGRSIPKLVIFDAEAAEELGQWGPRPAEAEQLRLKLKGQPDLPYSEIASQLQQWYTRDKGQQVQRELLNLLQAIEQVRA
mgnify:CR=1 FL=1